jgi:hypothetical protein
MFSCSFFWDSTAAVGFKDACSANGQVGNNQLLALVGSASALEWHLIISFSHLLLLERGDSVAPRFLFSL